MTSRRALASLSLIISAICICVIVFSNQRTDGSADSIKALELSQGSDPLITFLNELPPQIQEMIDSTADPCSDFHRFACGRWEDANPANKKSAVYYTESDNVWVLRSLEKIYAEDRSQLGTFYASCMDKEKVEARGSEPIQRWLRLVETVKDTSSLTRVLGTLQGHGFEAFFSTRVDVDIFHPTNYLLFLKVGGLGLDPTFYSSSEAFARNQRAALVSLYTSNLKDAGEAADSAERMAKEAIAVEEEMAKHSGVTDERFTGINPLWSIEELQERFPQIYWADVFQQAGFNGLSGSRQIHVSRAGWFERMWMSVGARPLGEIQSYLKSRLLHLAAPQLSQNFRRNVQTFDSSVLGTTSVHDWYRRGFCVSKTSHSLPMLSSYEFVSQYLPPDAKSKAVSITDDVRLAFHQDMLSPTEGGHSSWLSQETRVAAMEKLQKLNFEIGGPSDGATESFAVGSDYFENWIAGQKYQVENKARMLQGPVDRTMWLHSSATTDPYFVNGINTVFIPAGLIHEPFFSSEAPDAHNFGSFASIVGHEIVHAFDNHGKYFDAEGVKREWWDDKTIVQYQEREQCVVELYSGFRDSGISLDGQRTLGENIADIGGVHISYLAMEKHFDLERVDENAQIFNRRLFWLSYAHSFCGSLNAQTLREELRSDEHATEKFRIIGPLSQLKSFSKDFNCPVGSPMNPVKKCHIW